MSEFKDLVTKLTGKDLQLALDETEREKVKKYKSFLKIKIIDYTGY